MLKKAAALGLLAWLVHTMPSPPEKIEGPILRIAADDGYMIVRADNGMKVKVRMDGKTRIRVASTEVTLGDLVAMNQKDIDLRATVSYEGETASEIIVAADRGLQGRLYSVDVSGKQIVMLQPTDHGTFITWLVNITPQTRLVFHRPDKPAEETDLPTLLGLTRERRRLIMRVRPDKPVEEGDDSVTARRIVVTYDKEEEK